MLSKDNFQQVVFSLDSLYSRKEQGNINNQHNVKLAECKNKFIGVKEVNTYSANVDGEVEEYALIMDAVNLKHKTIDIKDVKVFYFIKWRQW